MLMTPLGLALDPRSANDGDSSAVSHIGVIAKMCMLKQPQLQKKHFRFAYLGPDLPDMRRHNDEFENRGP